MKNVILSRTCGKGKEGENGELGRPFADDSELLALMRNVNGSDEVSSEPITEEMGNHANELNNTILSQV